MTSSIFIVQSICFSLALSCWVFFQLKHQRQHIHGLVISGIINLYTACVYSMVLITDFEILKFLQFTNCFFSIAMFMMITNIHYNSFRPVILGVLSVFSLSCTQTFIQIYTETWFLYGVKWLLITHISYVVYRLSSNKYEWFLGGGYFIFLISQFVLTFGLFTEGLKFCLCFIYHVIIQKKLKKIIE